MRTKLVTNLKRKTTALDTLHRRLGILEGIDRGELAIEEGRVVTHAEARKRMARWLK